VHLVCDNYGTHKSPAIVRWLDCHPVAAQQPLQVEVAHTDGPALWAADQPVVDLQLALHAIARVAQSRQRATAALHELSLGEVKEAELLAAMDWLVERQPRIERTLARRHLPGDMAVRQRPLDLEVLVEVDQAAAGGHVRLGA
jgi:hypothetical protein